MSAPRPCPATVIAYLGFGPEGQSIPCGGAAGHPGRHSYSITWADDPTAEPPFTDPACCCDRTTARLLVCPVHPQVMGTFLQAHRDPEFMARIKASVEQHQPILDRLAEDDGPSAAETGSTDHDHADRCCREHGTHSTPHRGCILR